MNNDLDIPVSYTYYDREKGWPISVLNCVLNDTETHMEIEHDGTAKWSDLQDMKNIIWGEDAIAIEMYPKKTQTVNPKSTKFHFRHLWKIDNHMSWCNLVEDIA